MSAAYNIRFFRTETEEFRSVNIDVVNVDKIHSNDFLIVRKSIIEFYLNALHDDRCLLKSRHKII